MCCHSTLSHTLIQEYELKGYTISYLPPCVREDVLRAPDVVGRFNVICNGEGCQDTQLCEAHDCGRLQAEFNNRAVMKRLSEQLQDLLKREFLQRQQQIYSISALKTLPSTNQQGLHTDWPLETGVEHTIKTVPFTVLWAVLAGFELNIVPRHTPLCSTAATELVCVPRHHVIVFRGDLVHGGAGMLSQDWRLFARFKCPEHSKHVDVHMLTPSFGPTECAPLRSLPPAAVWQGLLEL